MPELFKFVALSPAEELCLFLRRDIEADSSKALRFSMLIGLHSPTRADPLHTAVRARHPEICLVILVILDCSTHRVPNFVAIVSVPSGNQVLKGDPSGNRETQLSTARRRDPDFILIQIPLPHSELGGIRSQIESLLNNF